MQLRINLHKEGRDITSKQKEINKEKQILKKQDTVTPGAPQRALPRIELEQHLRARAWKDDAFRQEFMTNPKAVLQHDYTQYFPDGQIPSELSIKVIEEKEQTICFVLPPKLSDKQLSKLEDLDDESLLSVSGGCTSAFSFCITACPISVCHRGVSQEVSRVIKKL
jgi:hypothetical protein